MTKGDGMGTIEEDFWRLDAAYNAAMEEGAVMDRVDDAVRAALGRIVRENYPGLANWRSEALRKLDLQIGRIACNFATDLAYLDAEGRRQD